MRVCHVFGVGPPRTALDDIGFAPLDDPRALAFEVSWEVPPSALHPPLVDWYELSPGVLPVGWFALPMLRRRT